MSRDHKAPPAPPPKALWTPGDELFFQILGVAIAVFLLKSAFLP